MSPRYAPQKIPKNINTVYSFFRLDKIPPISTIASSEIGTLSPAKISKEKILLGNKLCLNQ